MLAKNLEAPRAFRYPSLSLASIASMLAPTGAHIRQLSESPQIEQIKIASNNNNYHLDKNMFVTLPTKHY